MTVSSTTARVSASGNGTTVIFPYSHYFLDEDDLVVILRDSSGVETVQTKTTHYSVSGQGDTNGGSITMVTAPASGESLIIYNNPDATQTLNLVENDPLPAESLETALDRAILINQRSLDKLDRAVTLSEGYVASFDTNLPSVLTADAALIINSSANGFSMGPTTTDISNASTHASNASTYMNNASASAAAAATSETNSSQSETDASTAETNASTAETNSSQSETDASTAETNSSQSETDASTAATNASTAETNSSQSETDASTAETNASQSETDASTAETNASTSETNASTSETNASSSETNAAASAAVFYGRDVDYKTDSDSPITMAVGDIGKVFSLDASSGSIALTLAQISLITTHGPVTFIRTDSSTNTVTLSRASTDTIGPDSDTSITLDYKNHAVTLVSDIGESPDNWALIDFRGCVQQSLRYDTQTGYGSTDDKIPYFTTKTYDVGADLFSFSNDDTNGLKLTALTDIFIMGTIKHDYGGGGPAIGFSVDSSQLTTTIANITATDITASVWRVSGQNDITANCGIRLPKGSILRPHTSGDTPNAGAFVEFIAYR